MFGTVLTGFTRAHLILTIGIRPTFSDYRNFRNPKEVLDV